MLCQPSTIYNDLRSRLGENLGYCITFEQVNAIEYFGSNWQWKV